MPPQTADTPGPAVRGGHTRKVTNKKMANYIDQYRRLDARASDAEAHADQYRARADQDRWEQCRIAYEAVESGEYNRATFATAVGRGNDLIGLQYRAWANHGFVRARMRPSYSDAIAEASGTTVEAETGRKQLVHARKVLGDPKLRRQLLGDPDIRRKVMGDDRVRVELIRTKDEIDAHRVAKVQRKLREDAPRLAEAREYYEAEARLLHARQDVNQALNLLRGLPPLDGEQRDSIRETLGWLTTSVEWLYETVKARRSASLADEIESYLADQA